MQAPLLTKLKFHPSFTRLAKLLVHKDAAALRVFVRRLVRVLLRKRTRPCSWAAAELQPMLRLVLAKAKRLVSLTVAATSTRLAFVFGVHPLRN